MSNLDLIASKARAYAKKENSKEAAKAKRGRSSGDHFEEQMDYAILLVFLIHVGTGVVIAGILVTVFFLIF